MIHSKLKRNNPPFSSRVPWSQTWKYWPLSPHKLSQFTLVNLRDAILRPTCRTPDIFAVPRTSLHEYLKRKRWQGTNLEKPNMPAEIQSALTSTIKNWMACNNGLGNPYSCSNQHKIQCLFGSGHKPSPNLQNKDGPNWPPQYFCVNSRSNAPQREWILHCSSWT